MTFFRKSRALPRTSSFANTADVDNFLGKGPNDKPAGIRHNHKLLRSVGGW